MSNKTLLILSAIATPLLLAAMIFHGAPLSNVSETPRGIIDLELACTSARAAVIYEAWGPALRKHAIQNTYLDFAFLLSYGSLLFSLVKISMINSSGYWKISGKWIAAAMIVAPFFDAVENILMIKTLKGSMGNELVASTFMFASVKFYLIGAGILYLLLSFTLQKKRKAYPFVNPLRN